MKRQRNEQMKAYSSQRGSSMDVKKHGIEYLPLSAERMMKHLKYRAVRNAIYDEIKEIGGVDQQQPKEPNQSSLTLSMLTGRVNEIKQVPSTAKSKQSHIEQSLKIIKNFMRIFTGYNVNNTVPTHNLVNSIILKRNMLEEANEICKSADPKLKLRVPSSTSRVTFKNKSRISSMRKSHGIIDTHNLKPQTAHSSRLNSVR